VSCPLYAGHASELELELELELKLELVPCPLYAGHASELAHKPISHYYGASIALVWFL